MVIVIYNTIIVSHKYNITLINILQNHLNLKLNNLVNVLKESALVLAVAPYNPLQADILLEKSWKPVRAAEIRELFLLAFGL